VPYGAHPAEVLSTCAYLPPPPHLAAVLSGM